MKSGQRMAVCSYVDEPESIGALLQQSSNGDDSDNGYSYPRPCPIHMYIMPDSRPLFLLICSVIMPFHPSLYVSATWAFK
mmetsp:Transcript_14386/g.30187  ORF Transcript_14386/g.30187 Transcript_14386/m.30187 type:complete len:80 (+) Transcript_14386:74-313(+)